MPTRLTQDHRLTVQEALQAFCEGKLATSHYRPGTQDTYLRALREFIAFSSEVAYTDELSLASVQRYDAELQRRQQRPGSRHTKIAAIKTFLTHLEEQGALSAAFAQAIAVPTQVDAKPGRPIDVDEAAQLLRVAEEGGQARDVALMRMLLDTEISLTEAVELTVADLILAPALSTNSRSGNGVTRAKSSMSSVSINCRLRLQRRPATRDREASLDDATWQALNAYLAVRPHSPHPQIFLTDVGAPLSQSAASSIVKKYARAAGTPWIHARSLRTAYIMRQLAAGTPMAEVQARLGHRTLATTRRYLGLMESAVHVSAAARRTCGVLIVDEHRATRTQLRLLLEAADHHVFEAPDSVTALDMLRLSRLALVVVVSVWAESDDDGDRLSALMGASQIFADHRFIVILSEKISYPKQTLNLIAAHDIPVVLRPPDFQALLSSIIQGYNEMRTPLANQTQIGL